MYPPYVGILVNDNELRKIPLELGNTKLLNIMKRREKKYGFTPCFFRICDLRAGQKTVKAYVKQLEGYVRRKIPAPLVIHNRAIYLSKSQDRRLSSWVRDGRQLFNRWNRYGKLRIHQLMLENPSLHPHLPATRRATPDGIARLMKRFDSLIIKPNNSSIGRGVMRMDRTPTGWKLSYPISFGPVNQKWRTVRWKGTRLPAVLRSRLRKETYIVQQRLPLATFQGSPFDLRVSVQRTADGSWDVTGIVAKVASKHTFVTNVAQGGTTYQLPSSCKKNMLTWTPRKSYSVFITSPYLSPPICPIGFRIWQIWGWTSESRRTVTRCLSNATVKTSATASAKPAC